MIRFSITLFEVALLLFGLSLAVRAQVFSSDHPEMQAVESAIVKEPALAGIAHWKCAAVTPIEGTGHNVSIAQWTTDTEDGVVTIVLQVETSPSEAAKVLKNFASNVQGTRAHSIGDEAYTWGMRGAIALRRGAIVVYVSAVAIANPTDRNIEALLSKHFAQVSDAGLMKMVVKSTP